MYIVNIRECHGHNGDETETYAYKDYDEAIGYILNFYFDGNVLLMQEAEEDTDTWYCEEADTWIDIESAIEEC